MDAFFDSNVWAGLCIAASQIWVVPIGVFIGILVGALPGLGASNALAIFLPMLLSMPVSMALIFATSLYCGAEVGGSYPAILINIPGTGSAAVAAFDGYPMAKMGKPAQAMGVSIFASFVGGIMGGIVCLTCTPIISKFALSLSSVEMTVIIMFGVVVLGQMSSGGLAKGLVAGIFGLLVATTGSDPIWGHARATFGSLYLADGIPVIAALIGLLAFSELMAAMEDAVNSDSTQPQQAMMTNASLGYSGIFDGFRMTIVRWVNTIRSALIGVFIGAVPGAGASIASFVAYQQAANFSSPEDKQTFGKGNPDGIIAPEAANNGVVGGSLIPLLTLGIPGSSSMAVLMVVMAYEGLAVGPRLLEQNGDIVYALLWTQFTAALVMLILGTICAYFIYRMAYISLSVMIPIVSVFALIGGFAMRQFTFDMVLVLVFGVLGYVMKKYKYPPPAMLLGIILGPLLEANMFRGLKIGLGDPMVFFTRPLSAMLWGLLLLTFILPVLFNRMRSQKKRKN